MHKLFLTLSLLIFYYKMSISQEIPLDPVSEHNHISSIYLSSGISKVHYSNYNGVYDSINYSISNINYSFFIGGGINNQLFFKKEGSKTTPFLSYGLDFSSRGFKITYAGENLKINEFYVLPIIGVGNRIPIKHSLWFIHSYKAIEFKLNFGAPILLAQNTIINHSKVKASNAVYFKYHLGFELRFSSLESSGKGHQFGSEIFLENSSQTQPNTIPFNTPYYIGARIYYCILNKSL